MNNHYTKKRQAFLQTEIFHDSVPAKLKHMNIKPLLHNTFYSVDYRDRANPPSGANTPVPAEMRDAVMQSWACPHKTKKMVN